MMSSRYRRTSRDTERLAFDMGANAWLKACARDEVDARPELRLEVIFQLHKRGERRCRVKAHHHVHVAIVTGLVAGHRTEHAELGDAKPQLQLRHAGQQDSNRLGALHPPMIA